MKFVRMAAAGGALLLCLAGCSALGQGPQPTPTAEPTAIPTAAPTPEPTPIPTLQPAFNPLTGAADADYSGLRPIAVTLRTGEQAGPYWGIADADVVVAGVSEGFYAMLTALYATADQMTRVGPVGPARDLTLQMVLPLNAVPVHIHKNVYASNLLNVLAYQDVDGYHIGTQAFVFDEALYAGGTRQENCWYTTGALVQNGLSQYGAGLAGGNRPLFNFAQQPVTGSQNAAAATVRFSLYDAHTFTYDRDSGLYRMSDGEGHPITDAATDTQVAFTNVVVLYASSGIKDDTYTRQYDMSGGDGVYLTAGGWQAIRWSKEDAAAPLVLSTAEGQPLLVNPGKSYIAIWGGYYSQALQVVDENGAEQPLPAKPPLLPSGVSDEAAAAAEQVYAVANARAALEAARQREAAAQAALEAALATPDDSEDDYQAALALQNAQEDIANALAILERLGATE